jgi:hypothetical protein
LKYNRFLSWGGLALLMATLAGGPFLNAQLAVTTATLSGAVTDSSGAVVPQAEVKIASGQNGITRSFTSDATGRYTFTQLPPSTYNLEIQAKGFETYKQTGIVLDAGQSATQDIALIVGSATQQVVVNAQASQFNTDNANISADINAKAGRRVAAQPEKCVRPGHSKFLGEQQFRRTTIAGWRGPEHR